MLRLPFLMLLLISLAARAEIYYFHGDSVAVPSGSIVAVEARAEHKGGQWSIVWPGACITLGPAASQFVDGVDEPLARITCGEHSVTAKGFECYGGYNTLAVEWSADGRAHILGGKNELHQLMVLDSLPKPQDAIRVLEASSIAEIIVETNPNNFDRLTTGYSDDEINAGKVWRYLDRESDPKIALLGGNYILTQIGNDLLYLAGAKTNAAHWRKGMLKGQLTPTGYEGYYRLQWYDATGRKLADESFAQFDPQASTMTLTFPGLQASLRFTSLMESGVAVGAE